MVFFYKIEAEFLKTCKVQTTTFFKINCVFILNSALKFMEQQLKFKQLSKQETTTKKESKIFTT